MAAGLISCLAGFAMPVAAGCAKCSANFVCEVKAPDCKAGERCDFHDDDCGNWESFPEKFPEPRAKLNPIPVFESLHNEPTELCVPGVRGPVIPRAGAAAALKAAEGNWLLAAALIRLEDVAAEGIFDSGAFAFGIADTPAQQAVALAGKELPIPEVRFTGFNGFAEYRTYPADKIASPGLMAADTELHIWRLDRAKLVPTHGLKAYVHFEKDVKTGLWYRKSVQVKYVMPTASRGVFENMDDHKEIVDEYLVKKSRAGVANAVK